MEASGDSFDQQLVVLQKAFKDAFDAVDKAEAQRDSKYSLLESQFNQLKLSSISKDEEIKRLREQLAMFQSNSALPEGCPFLSKLGDVVVYLRQGHEEYMEERGLRKSGPWATLRGEVRAVELCKVEELLISTHPDSDEISCKVLLRFVDSASSLVGKSFRFSLTKVTDFPDFVVERDRYEAGISRKWTSRDECRVCHGGSWLDARITSVKAKSSIFPNSPWKSCVVQFMSEPSETHHYSPWELYGASPEEGHAGD